MMEVQLFERIQARWCLSSLVVVRGFGDGKASGVVGDSCRVDEGFGDGGVCSDLHVVVHC